MSLFGTLFGTDPAGGGGSDAQAADDYPPSARPDYLKPFAHVKGQIVSAPLDLAARFNNVVTRLETAGWTVSTRSIGTDFSSGGFGFLPVPKSQTVDLLLNRTDRPFTADEATQALSDAIGQESMDYSPIGSWVGELYTNVAVPTVQDALSDASKVADAAAPALYKSLAIVTGVSVLGLILYAKLKPL
jgi:hypothetical protein